MDPSRRVSGEGGMAPAVKTQLCVVATGFGHEADRRTVWPAAADDFLRKMHRLGTQITVVGPRPPGKFGSKKTIRFLDRHEVVGFKRLAASRSHGLELRILGTRARAWTRLRAEACVAFGPYGVWPASYEGWNAPGTMTIQAFSRWMEEYHMLPGRELAFVGSSNQSVRWACLALDRGARECTVVETGASPRCWRAMRDRFAAKGGRYLVGRAIRRASAAEGGRVSLLLADGRVIKADAAILAASPDDALNQPPQWKQGLFYVMRRTLQWEPGAADGASVGEESWLESLDWREIYWRVARFLGSAGHGEAEGALKLLRAQRRRMLDYRRSDGEGGRSAELGYSGKMLDRETLARVQDSPSVPRAPARAKPVASLECLEDVACRACADACPEDAIAIDAITDQPRLTEDRCTGCGACVAACPAGAAVMLREIPNRQKTRLFLPDDTGVLWKPGHPVHLLNRNGEMLGAARVVSTHSHRGGNHRVLELEAVDTHLWDGRTFQDPPIGYTEDSQGESQGLPSHVRRGWITLNGSRRLSPLGVPITIALWQLGIKRFEDALFCQDGGCGMCAVTVDGKPRLACRVLAREGQVIEIARAAASPALPRCVCSGVSAEEYAAAVAEGASESLAREITGTGHGSCHGRWCLAAREPERRPVFHGFEGSPWRDLYVGDMLGE